MAHIGDALNRRTEIRVRHLRPAASEVAAILKRLNSAKSGPWWPRQNLGRSERSIAMNSDDRQAVLDAIEAEFRTEKFGYFFLEAEEFARFDISVTYLGGHDALTVQRCREHLAALYSVVDDSIALWPTSALERGPEAREALRTFFRHLYS